MCREATWCCCMLWKSDTVGTRHDWKP
jgi:hypothetical protein